MFKMKKKLMTAPPHVLETFSPRGTSSTRSPGLGQCMPLKGQCNTIYDVNYLWRMLLERLDIKMFTVVLQFWEMVINMLLLILMDFTPFQQHFSFIMSVTYLICVPGCHNFSTWSKHTCVFLATKNIIAQTMTRTLEWKVGTLPA